MGFAQVRKAVVAAATAALGAASAAYATAIQDGAISNSDWSLIIGAALVAALLAGVPVFLVPNAPVKA